jgi:pSer/pThr/pTyr-binding forkhead associated (FHA) protein
VRPDDHEQREPHQGEEGRTMVYSSAERIQEPLREPDPRRASAKLRIDGRTALLGTQGATLGRSRDCEVVLEDANVSRKHAEVRPSGGSWVVRDLGSTNGVKVNGRRITGAQSLKRGDAIELGTSRVIFDLD